MQDVINACKRHKAKLVFFDHVYMYDGIIFFDSTKFEKRFNFISVSPKEGIRQVKEALDKDPA